MKKYINKLVHRKAEIIYWILAFSIATHIFAPGNYGKLGIYNTLLFLASYLVGRKIKVNRWFYTYFLFVAGMVGPNLIYPYLVYQQYQTPLFLSIYSITYIIGILLILLFFRKWSNRFIPFALIFLVWLLALNIPDLFILFTN